MIFEHVPEAQVANMPEPNNAVLQPNGLYTVYTHKHYTAPLSMDLADTVSVSEEPKVKKQRRA